MVNCTQVPKVHFLNEKDSGKTLCGKDVTKNDKSLWWVKTDDQKHCKEVNCPHCVRIYQKEDN